MLVDRHPDRLALGEKIGAIPIDDSKVDSVEQMMKLTGGEGADKGIDAVGWQAHDPQGHEQPNLVLNSLVNAVRATGQQGIIGVYVPQDPGGPDELAKQGQVAFDFGLFFQKGLRMGCGQANVKDYNRQLRDLIAAERPTGTSTTATTAGPRSSSTPQRADRAK